MKKIPTVFRRDPDDMKRVLAEVNPGCEWVLAGEGTATRKYDGTCTMFDGERWWARREVKPSKQPPAGWIEADAPDPITGKRVGWEPVEHSGFAKWHAEALAVLQGFGQAIGRDIATGTYELCGPKVNGNPEGYVEHMLIRHETAELVDLTCASYDDLAREITFLGRECGFEGVVWHHPDGRMAKLKARDFPRTVASEGNEKR